MSGMALPANETFGGYFRGALAMDVDNLPRESRQPSRRSSGVQGHARQVPMRNENCAVRNSCFILEYEVALQTQSAAPLKVAHALRLKQPFQDRVFVQKLKPEHQSQLLR